MNAWLYYTLAIGLVAAGFVCWLINLLSLPGNWALLVLTALFAWLVPHASAAASRGTRCGSCWRLPSWAKSSSSSPAPLGRQARRQPAVDLALAHWRTRW